MPQPNDYSKPLADALESFSPSSGVLWMYRSHCERLIKPFAREINGNRVEPPLTFRGVAEAAMAVNPRANPGAALNLTEKYEGFRMRELGGSRDGRVVCIHIDADTRPEFHLHLAMAYGRVLCPTFPVPMDLVSRNGEAYDLTMFREPCGKRANGKFRTIQHRYDLSPPYGKKGAAHSSMALNAIGSGLEATGWDSIDHAATRGATPDVRECDSMAGLCGFFGVTGSDELFLARQTERAVSEMLRLHESIPPGLGPNLDESDLAFRSSLLHVCQAHAAQADLKDVALHASGRLEHPVQRVRMRL
ncbi:MULTISPECIES: hypothetical protein [unclassified Thioalkalivibrio]|uniref:hypothetical protein n=1 Tax=unclassified Thioalkalivibrio TaxID=2621013 RepID=UPI000362B498|nr:MULTISPECIES: hypothetical protein [unclassified Thioalkalivibrio]